MELTEIRDQFEELRRKSVDLRGFLDLDRKAQRLKEIEHQLTDSDIWNHPRKSTVLLKEKKRLETDLALGKRFENDIAEIETYLDLAADDSELLAELETEMERFSGFIEKTEIRNYLSGDHDLNNAFLSIHPGAGGTESHDWAEILLRMYLRFAERMEYNTEIVEILAGEEAGIKSVTVRMDGEYAYGYLKQEIGVHRLVRISPFDAAGRRHTSFAAVFVYPEVDDRIEIELDPKDLRVDTYRASGAGGQHVNRTDSAVRITHLPTNTVAQCQSERSQHQNRERAMNLMKAKLYDLELKKKNKERDRMENEKGEIAWGNQIRSYVLQPYQSIKDHRTGLEIGNTQRVLDGDILTFIKASLKQR
ncbi:MAG TPA: peptide chain release factor 2 [Candidatus Aminicenantes bacterium]|nr:peptide chain release factor 2 [Candidatus Aminicenantes bacterium]